MDNQMLNKVTLDEFKIFYEVDRLLYIVLVKQLGRHPVESLQIMGLWLWIERLGVCTVISRVQNIRSMQLINALAVEALAILRYMNDGTLPASKYIAEIPLTHCLLGKSLSREFFYINRETILQEVRRLISDVYIPALSDLVDAARRDFAESSTSAAARGMSLAPSTFAASSSAVSSRRFLPPAPTPRTDPIPSVVPIPPAPYQSVVPIPSTPYEQFLPLAPAPPTVPIPSAPYEDQLVASFSGLNIQSGSTSTLPRHRARPDACEYDRTMFATFSKGYPVSEEEVMAFFTAHFGNCIEALHMQEVSEGQQPLFARVVFVDPSYIQVILGREAKAKFAINGKHVWMRRFVPRNSRPMQRPGRN